jgi:hypothetical protein
MNATAGRTAEQKTRRGSGVAIALAGLMLAFVASYLPLWSTNNPWVGSEVIDPSIPTSFYGIGSVTWWGVLGPDVADRTNLITALLVTWVPVGIVILSTIVPLMVKRLRASFGPVLLVAVAMWGGQILAWAALSNDNHDTWRLEVGGYLLLIGIAICAFGAAWDLTNGRRLSR